MTDRETKIFDEAFHQWGVTSQLDMLVEECAELIKAVNKLKRAKEDKTNDRLGDLFDEMADVRLMLNQIGHKFGMPHVSKRYEFKLDRLAKRLNIKV